MTVIYGLREVGSDEVRYVGRTDGPLEKRLHKHRLNVRQGYPDRICNWIASAEAIEIISITECPAEVACQVERETVRDFWESGHRLTNGHLIPRATGEAA